jgi:WD40 repeat protein
VAYHPDGHLLATASADRSVRIWDTLKDTLLHEFEEHLHGVTDVQWSPDGSLLASGGADGTIRLWEVPEEAAEQ